MTVHIFRWVEDWLKPAASSVTDGQRQLSVSFTGILVEAQTAARKRKGIILLPSYQD